MVCLRFYAIIIFSSWYRHFRACCTLSSTREGTGAFVPLCFHITDLRLYPQIKMNSWWIGTWWLAYKICHLGSNLWFSKRVHSKCWEKNIFRDLKTNGCDKMSYYYFWLHQVLVGAPTIFSCGMWDPVPWPEIEPGPHALGPRSLSHWTIREVPKIISWLIVLWQILQEKIVNATFQVLTWLKLVFYSYKNWRIAYKTLGSHLLPWMSWKYHPIFI